MRNITLDQVDLHLFDGMLVRVFFIFWVHCRFVLYILLCKLETLTNVTRFYFLQKYFIETLIRLVQHWTLAAHWIRWWPSFQTENMLGDLVPFSNKVQRPGGSASLI